MSSIPVLDRDSAQPTTQTISPPITAPADVQKSLLFAAIENFADGLVIVGKTGQILHCNRCAQQLLQRIEQPPRPALNQTITALPQPIWQICQVLMTAETPFSETVKVVLEDEIRVIPADRAHATHPEERIRVRVQWFNADAQDCFLVMLEDCLRSAECFAQNEAYRYQLTPREAEVWQLKRANHSYKEIAQQLYISENTVKKHLKNVYAKREQFA